MPYLGRQGQFGVRDRFQYLASAGDTSVSGADANGITMTFSDGLYIDVFLNGIKLKAGEDYNTDTANTVAGISAMNSNDEVEVIAYDAFTVADTVSAADGGTFSGNIAMSGTLSVTGATTVTGGISGTLNVNDTTEATSTTDGSLQTDGGLSVVKDAVFGDDVKLLSDSSVVSFGADSDVTLTHVADTGVTLSAGNNDTVLQIDSNASDAGVAPKIILNRTSDSPADNDFGGTIIFQAENDNNQQFTSCQFNVKSTDVSDGTEDSQLQIETIVNGSATSGLIIEGGGVNHVIPSLDSTYDLGSNTVRFRQGYIDEIDIGDNSLAASAGNAMFVGYAGGGAEYGIEVKTNASTGVAMYFLHSTTTAAGSISVASSATSFNTSSDYRLKENVVDMTGAITRLKNLKPKRFNWISDASNELIDGFLAHEVDAVVPQAVHGEKDATKDVGTIKDADGNVLRENTVESTKKDGETWEKTGTEIDAQGIDQSKLVPLLTAALQEAITKIETLETKVTALESK